MIQKNGQSNMQCFGPFGACSSWQWRFLLIIFLTHIGLVDSVVFESDVLWAGIALSMPDNTTIPCDDDVDNVQAEGRASCL